MNKLKQILGGFLFIIVSNGSSSEITTSTVQHHQVLISGFEFVPKVLKVSYGDTVTWVNKDIVPHNIVTRDKQLAISPSLASGEKFIYTVKKSLSYECGFHPSMKGALVAP